jgi:hypothetical protein
VYTITLYRFLAYEFSLKDARNVEISLNIQPTTTPPTPPPPPPTAFSADSPTVLYISAKFSLLYICTAIVVYHFFWGVLASCIKSIISSASVTVGEAIWAP